MRLASAKAQAARVVIAGTGELGRTVADALLAHRDFVRYAAARFLATLSWQILAVAVGWQTYEVTRDPLALGLVDCGNVKLTPSKIVDAFERIAAVSAAHLGDGASAVGSGHDDETLGCRRAQATGIFFFRKN